MFQNIIRLLTVISVGLLLSLVAVIIIVNSSLLTPTTEFLLSQWLSSDTKIGQVTYTAPNHLTLNNVILNNDVPIKRIDVWPTLYPKQLSKPEFDALLLNGFVINSDQKLPLPLQKWNIHQLSLNDVSLQLGEWQAKHTDIQWINPEWQPHSIWPYGTFQIHTRQLNWQHEQFLNLLVNGDIRPAQSQLNGLSFKWNNASIQARAFKDATDDQWVVNELTLENLQISGSDFSPERRDKLLGLTAYIKKIDRADLLRGQIEWNSATFNNLELSVTNLDINQSLLWQQNDTHLSLKAEGIEDQGILWVEPNLKLELNDQSVDIQDLNTELSGGDIYFSALLQPAQAQIRKLDIIGVRHSIEERLPHYDSLLSYLQQLEKLQVDKLSIHNGQLIQLANQPYWQLSGINLDLNQASLIDKKQWGLWNGRFYASVNSLSYDKVLATQAIAEMQSDGTRWDLSRFFMPFSVGYINAKGEWLFGSAGKPWKLDAETDSLPLKLFDSWPLPLKIQGLLDLRLTAHGLSGDETILRHTLSGALDASIRQGSVALPDADATVNQPFSLEGLHINANNGMLEANDAIAQGPEFYGTLHGGLDLRSDNNRQQLSLTFTENGVNKTLDILNPAAN